MIDLDVKFQYEGEESPTLKRVRADIPAGKCVVLCGGSGCGKSTLLRCVNGLAPQFYEGELKGFCRINGRDTADMSVGDIGELAASVFQDPRSQFFTINSSTEVAFGLENHGVPQEEIRRRVDEAFSAFRLEYLKDRNVYGLSSGERQLVSILSAWAMDTDVILLDEPTANLDYAAIEELKGVLAELKRQGKTLLISEHRLYYLKELADEFWVMKNGGVERRFSAQEMAALPPQELGGLSLRTLDFSGITVQNTDAPRGAQILEIKDAAFSYSAKAQPVLRGASLTVREHEAVGLIGENGCGKTTLGKIIAGLYRPSRGTVCVNGRAMKPRALQKQTMFIMQEAEFQFFTNSVLNELKYAHRETQALDEKIEELLRDVGMWEYRDRHPFSLSGGQMQKLTLLTAYLSDKPIIVLDEPTAGLDAQSLESCCALIRRMQQEKTVLIITHDLELIARVCGRCICISGGAVSGEYPVRQNADIQAIRRHMESEFTRTAKPLPAKQRPCLLHPITKLLFWLAAIVVISTSDNSLVYAVYAALLVMAAADGWLITALAGGAAFAALWGLNALLPNTVMSFIMVLFPRIIAVGASMRTLISRGEAGRTLAALRCIHTPERLIMICAVVFRFFPVLSGDMKLLRQSIKTRGAYVTLSQKLRALPEYIELLTVPMALRVIRIAETLSASAEARGIDLRRRKSNYLSLRCTAWDVVFRALLAAAAAAGILL